MASGCFILGLQYYFGGVRPAAKKPGGISY
jgi:hypothetical protein